MTATTTGHGGTGKTPNHRGVLQGATVLWCGPTVQQTRVGWDEFFTSAGGVAEFLETRKEIRYPTGGRVLFRSLDEPDNSRGLTADGLVVDEASLVTKAAWYEVLRPMISDTGGWVLMQGTPKGHNWFWQEWVKAADEADSQAWVAPTLGVTVREDQLVRFPHPLENPDFLFEEAQRMWRQQPERVFRQEFLAEFVEDAGGVFRHVVRAVNPSVAQPHAIHPGVYAFGVDWGKYQDFTVIAVVELRQGHLVALDRFNHIDFEVQYDRLKAMVDRFHPTTIIAEQNAMGIPAVEQLQRRGLPVQPFLTTNETKRVVIESLANAFERDVIKMLDDEVLTAELQAYQTERTPSGLLKYSAPEGMHDDTVMALALAWQAMAVTTPPTAAWVVGPKRTTAEMLW